jgi:molecular chaperone GrpE
MNFVEEITERLARLEETVVSAARKREAEMEAVRARLEKELQLKVSVERSRLVLMFIDILDELERATAHADASATPSMPADAVITTGDTALLTGINQIILMFRKRLDSLGVQKIEVVGKAYDPETAHAIGVNGGAAGVVTQEVLSGYTLDGVLIRPAKVLVGSGV